jgi:anti-sigma B factor antagonist
MDKVTYQYVNNLNQLTLSKCLPREELIEDEGFTVVRLHLDSNFDGLRVQGRVDGMSSPQLASALQDVMAGGSRRIVIDLGGVDYMSSSGLKVLASAWRECDGAGGALVLASLNERLLDLFDIVGFNTFFDIYPDVNTAISSSS